MLLRSTYRARLTGSKVFGTPASALHFHIGLVSSEMDVDSLGSTCVRACVCMCVRARARFQPVRHRRLMTGHPVKSSEGPFPATLPSHRVLPT